MGRHQGRGSKWFSFWGKLTFCFLKVGESYVGVDTHDLKEWATRSKKTSHRHTVHKHKHHIALAIYMIYSHKPWN